MASSISSQQGSSKSINTGVTLPKLSSNPKETVTVTELSPNTNANANTHDEVEVGVEAEARLHPSPIHSPLHQDRSIDIHIRLRHQDRLLADRAAEITYLHAAHAAELQHLRSSHEVLRLQSEMRENELLYSLDVQEVFKIRGERLNEDLNDENCQQRRAIQAHEGTLATLQRENNQMRRNNHDLYLMVSNFQAGFLHSAEIENSRGVGYTHDSVRGFCWELSHTVEKLEEQLRETREELQAVKDKPVQIRDELQDRRAALEDRNRELQMQVEWLEGAQKAQEGNSRELEMERLQHELQACGVDNTEVVEGNNREIKALREDLGERESEGADIAEGC